MAMKRMMDWYLMMVKKREWKNLMTMMRRGGSAMPEAEKTSRTQYLEDLNTQPRGSELGFA